jgi:uncharacterized protein (TIGR03435 family)
MRLAFITVLLGLSFTNAQTREDSSNFEAATVKPWHSSGAPDPNFGHVRGGPGGTGSPGQFTATGMSLSKLLFQWAYNFNAYQYVGIPWMDKELYDVAAKLPAGTTRQQFQIMLRSLLTEQFKIVSHYEQREMRAYDLSLAKGGPKMEVSSAGKSALRIQWSGGFPVIPPDVTPYTMVTFAKGQKVYSTNQYSMPDLASLLSTDLHIPVLDKTSLTVNYAFLLHYNGGTPTLASITTLGDEPPGNADTEFAPTIFEALKSQLGLTLTETRTIIAVLVIDSAEKTPIEN